jgi:flagellar biogenesis protein FliO
MKLLKLFLLPCLLAFAEPSTNEEIKPEEVQTEEVVPQSDPPIISGDTYKKDFYTTLFSLVIVLVIAIVLTVLIKKLGKNKIFQMNGTKNIKVLEQRFISPNTSLFHVQVGDKQFIISESKLEVKFITNLDWNQNP